MIAVFSDLARYLSVVALVFWGGVIVAEAQLTHAQTVRWARASDAVSIDPHAQNESVTHGVAHQYYEPLVIIGTSSDLLPTLATSWSSSPGNPSVWRFRLRQGVTFHDGTKFTASDVAFSIKRAKSESSQVKGNVRTIDRVEVIDDHTIDIHTNGPDPVLPKRLGNVFIMSEQWSREHDAVEPQDVKSNEEKYTTRHANGTGAYELIERFPGERTVMRRNENYWGRDQFPLEIEEIVFLPIPSGPTRLAALRSGEVDIVQDVPVPDIEKLQGSEGINLNQGPENRTIFLAFNQGAADLAFDSVEGVNPFADVRVREAFNLAVDRDTLKRITMRGNSDPSGVIIPPFVNGWTPQLATYRQDLDRAKELLAEAGYPEGFAVTLHCPNNRYVSDASICQAVSGMFGRIGVDVTMVARPKAQHFKEMLSRELDFYMLGWGSGTYDSSHPFEFLVHSTVDRLGSWNATGYANPEVDRLIQTIGRTVDMKERDRLIAQVWERVQSDYVYLPLHNQLVSWAMVDRFDLPIHPENHIHFKTVRIN